MSSTLAARDPLMPRSSDGTAPGAVMSLLAHAALLAALAYGVSWRAPTPQVVSAELWAAVPQVAAPPPAPVPQAVKPEPAPAPPPPAPLPKTAPPAPLPDPQIAIEKARREKAEKARQEAEEQARRERLAREKAERDRLERERAEREKAEALALARARETAARRAKEAEEARLAKQREDNLRRMMGQLEGPTGSGAPTSRGSAAVDAAPSAAYAGRLMKAIKDNLLFAWRGSDNPAAVVEVRAAPSGTIMGRTLVKSSGHKDWDDAVLRAIDRTARLPADTDGRVPPTLVITFKPQD